MVGSLGCIVLSAKLSPPHYLPETMETVFQGSSDNGYCVNLDGPTGYCETTRRAMWCRRLAMTVPQIVKSIGYNTGTLASHRKRPVPHGRPRLTPIRFFASARFSQMFCAVAVIVSLMDR